MSSSPSLFPLYPPFILSPLRTHQYGSGGPALTSGGVLSYRRVATCGVCGAERGRAPPARGEQRGPRLGIGGREVAKRGGKLQEGSLGRSLPPDSLLFAAVFLSEGSTN